MDLGVQNKIKYILITTVRATMMDVALPILKGAVIDSRGYIYNKMY